MEINSESLRFILGIKVKQFRQQKNLSLKELGEKTGMSVSYLSEIEKGKKYPKPEKIIQLAQGLGQSFDDLVSLHLEDENNPVSALLNSPVFQEFPLHQFGITLTDVFDLVTNTPSKAGAFVRTLLEIGRNYDMQVEHFLLASLRSYQKMHQNYFEEIEAFAVQFRKEYAEQIASGVNCEVFEEVLQQRMGVAVEYEDLSHRPGLESLRSIWIDGPNEKVVINTNLNESQRMFILAREIGYRYIDLKDRPNTSSWMKVESFDQVYNNFKVSYFAGAVILPEEALIRDMTAFFQQEAWSSELLIEIMGRYNATPEMFLHRISQLLPHHFGMQRLHYLRLQNEVDSEKYHLTKELNTTTIFVPRGIGGNEHHCRRWIAISLMKQLAEAQKSGDNPALLVASQRSRFMASGEEFFNIAVARPLSLLDGMNSGMTLGFQIDKNFQSKVAFWNDPDVPQMRVNETCERCPLTDAECEHRIAPPRILMERLSQQQREDNLKTFLKEKMG
ncbi:XRE family transcriptional regulator [Gynuella sunshinyii]|uniref:Putative transcriptional regulator n=1 Tax=Gynuella sunshinyii YC6258 TaxID=1445510 RepID=A0A0C5VM71_9GAMM|nr:XRE family transcriptional regulator [Gynuella sunshinyii]AJQ94453.1 putative transcriptional regulator [Gynuella sunshinyii YC6258]